MQFLVVAAPTTNIVRMQEVGTRVHEFFLGHRSPVRFGLPGHKFPRQKPRIWETKCTSFPEKTQDDGLNTRSGTQGVQIPKESLRFGTHDARVFLGNEGEKGCQTQRAQTYQERIHALIVFPGETIGFGTRSAQVSQEHETSGRYKHTTS